MLPLRLHLGALRRSGPHFLDWSELADLGAASCASVPVYLNGVPRGTITFASRDPGVFSRCVCSACGVLNGPEAGRNWSLNFKQLLARKQHSICNCCVH